MDDAGELSALLGLDWNHVPAVAQRDDRLLYRRSRGVKELVEARGGDAFTGFSLPEAILKLRQGVGRLIRTKTDRGIVVILDNRIVTRPYGRAFMQALPKCPVEIL